MSCGKSIIRSSPLVGTYDMHSTKRGFESRSSSSCHINMQSRVRSLSQSSADINRGSTVHSLSLSTDREHSDRSINMFTSNKLKPNDKHSIVPVITSKTTRKRPSLTRPGITHVIVKTTYNSGEVSTDIREEVTAPDSRPIQELSSSKQDFNRGFLGVDSNTLSLTTLGKGYCNRHLNTRSKAVGREDKRQTLPRRHVSDQSEYISLLYPNNWEKNLDVFADVLRAGSTDRHDGIGLRRNISVESRNVSGILGGKTFVD